MKRLKNKHWRCLLSFTFCIVLFQGCGKKWEYYEPRMLAQFGFIQSEQIVDVDADTKSFRIVGEWTTRDNWDEDDVFFSPYAHSPLVFLDTIKTTAIPDEHFINEVEPRLKTIGDFTPMDSNHMYYKDVKLLPENIKSEIIIYYDIDYGYNQHELIQRHKVILRPKTNNE